MNVYSAEVCMFLTLFGDLLELQTLLYIILNKYTKVYGRVYVPFNGS